MIQRKTLDALNYFLRESLLTIKDDIKELEEIRPESNLIILKKGELNGLRYALHLINHKWKDETEE